MTVEPLNIRRLLRSNSRILKNMSWLAALQFANCVIPLVLIPYIIRTAGLEAFGKISYAQNIVLYLTVLVNFGFEYSATQEVALNRDNRKQTNIIFWSVLRSKAVLLAVSFGLLAIGLIFVDELAADRRLYIYTALMNIGFAVFPTWFLQGMEDVAKITVFNFSSRLVGAVMIILLVTAPNDYPYYLLILSCSYILGGGVALLYVIRKYRLRYTSQNDSLATRKGLPIFVNNMFATIYSAVGLTMLRYFVSDLDLGLYSAAYKVIMAVLMIVSYPISISLFPSISRRFNESFADGWRFFKRSFFLVVLFGAVCSIVIFLLSDVVIKVLVGLKSNIPSEDFQASADILRIFSLLPILVLSASMLTVQGMYGLQLQRYAPYIGGAICLFSLAVNYIFIKNIGIQGAAFSYVAAEIVEIILVGLLIYFNYKKRKQ